MRSFPGGITVWGLGGDENRKNRCGVTRLVKVLQIQAVIPGLIQIRRAVFPLPALELDRKHRWAGYQNGVNPRPEARDVKFEEQGAGDVSESGTEDGNL
jgi:hypothetical protein